MISSGAHHTIERCLTDLTMLRFLKQRAELICTFFQLSIEKDYWNYVDILITMPIGTWLSQISKNITQKNSINWDHTKTKLNIKRRQQIITNKLRHAECNIYLHLQQPYPFHSEIKNNISMNHQMNLILDGILLIVKHSLYYFRLNFEQKRMLLNFDIKDVQLVKSFYDLNPTKDQISIVQKIWRTKANSCKRAIGQKKKNHSSIMHPIILNRMKQEQLIPIQPFTSPMSTIIESRLLNIEQRAERLITFRNIVQLYAICLMFV
ncbi:unnamed protein product [Adineta steineri]|uniref:Uncharacterized protein n=1 Tax=Adineta steineri TaxID=433720 RepID=A0A814J3C2_9BILA|nr:unnamed protein product [Adineta steineri]